MKTDQKGFTLVEVITSLMIFAVIMAVAVPVYLELKHHQTLRSQKLEAAWLLQSRMEKVQQEPSSTKGQEQIQEGAVTYQLKWKKSRMGTYLMGTEVEVSWKNERRKKENLKLKGVQYTP
ncbi:type II secretion system protein [Kroppenstedtia pulmonis]|uniref:Type II secretion system protein n=1 Tax=Kroppenstedtia pulmonis TaxID=1380685 RepID=A0A7D3XQK2_9BACL|nr:type II secretion system protein [Kroppenstedtia pulmonis]QKG84847.1 type II secretion system protein [Kroppenstedtia pulmonis]